MSAAPSERITIMLETIRCEHQRSYWDRYNVALTSSLSVLRDAAEIALELAEIDQERNADA